MRHLVATTVAILAALATLSSCTVPTYNLDAIVIHGQPEVVDILSAAVTRLGGTVTQAGHAVDTDAQQAYCVNTSTTSTLAVTTGRNIHVCDAWTKAPTAMRRRSLWHELGHVFGAVHSVNSADLMYAIPRVDDYTEADIAQMCGSGVVRGGVCD